MQVLTTGDPPETSQAAAKKEALTSLAEAELEEKGHLRHGEDSTFGHKKSAW